MQGLLSKLFGRGEKQPERGLAPGDCIYAIGDIHGRADLLAGLLLRIEEHAAGHASPRLVFLGDYVDRGEQSREVLEICLATQRSPRFETVFLRGNHEDALLRFLERPEEGGDWLSFGGLATLMSYGVPGVAPSMAPARLAEVAERFRARLPAGHLDFLENLELSWQSGGTLFCHAGVSPDLAAEDQAESTLLWGDPEFRARPWRDGLRVVHGHYVTSEPEVLPHRIGIDTGAYFSGRLTALRLEGAEHELLDFRG